MLDIMGYVLAGYGLGECLALYNQSSQLALPANSDVPQMKRRWWYFLITVLLCYVSALVINTVFFNNNTWAWFAIVTTYLITYFWGLRVKWRNDRAKEFTYKWQQMLLERQIKDHHG